MCRSLQFYYGHVQIFCFCQNYFGNKANIYIVITYTYVIHVILKSYKILYFLADYLFIVFYYVYKRIILSVNCKLNKKKDQLLIRLRIFSLYIFASIDIFKFHAHSKLYLLFIKNFQWNPIILSTCSAYFECIL